MNDQTDPVVEQLLDSPHLADALESDRFKQFLDHIPVAIAVSELRPSESITYANREFERLTGCAAANIEGKSWKALPGMAAAREDDERLSHAVEEGEEYIGSFAIALDDRTVEVDAWSNTIQDDDGVDIFRLVALAEIGHDRSQLSDYERKLREKDALLLELQHRVKNNLQMITALIRLEARNLPDEDTEKRFDRLAGRINALSLLYDLLSTSGQSEEASIDLGVYLSQVASSVMQAHAIEGIRFDLLVDTWPVSINVAMPAGLVVNELLTNALKHAFKGRDHGTIRLHSLIDDTGCHIIISDDGVGLPDGVTWPKPGKLSAVIAQSLRQNAGATFTVDSAPGAGVNVTLFFARKEAAADRA
ncbi:MAG TPA: histidine kinase dimerization/phosphoacceptor domain -containing protein [Sphingomonas sp.]|nr:histidine kinase dimerization/phosphoacceptor domain -containing protein [Sphingomonas sp.]